jgi:hypothetical protein
VPEQTKHLPRWPVTLAIVLVLAVQLTLPEEVSAGPPWGFPVVLFVLLLPLVARNPIRNRHVGGWKHLARLLAVLVMVSNLVRLGNLSRLILRGDHFEGGSLIWAAVVVLLTNIVGMAVLFWEFDRGGPAARDKLHPGEAEREMDLQFPQDTMSGPAYDDWRPSFVDYLFVAFTATIAFSPTDTMPLTRMFKVYFMIAAVTATVTIAVVAARAVSLV